MLVKEEPSNINWIEFDKHDFASMCCPYLKRFVIDGCCPSGTYFSGIYRLSQVVVSLLLVEDRLVKWPGHVVEVFEYFAPGGLADPFDREEVSLQGTGIIQALLHLFKALALIYLCPTTDSATKIITFPK